MAMDLQALDRKAAADNEINWITATFMALFHVGAIAALFWFSWKSFFVSMFLWWVSGSLGIGMGYHRLLTHRGYKTPKWVEYFLTTCATLALEGGPIFWVATHRVHHQFSDQEGDPHTPHDGTWWAHAGWILSGRALHSETALLGRYAPDLTKDPVHVWLSKYHWIPLVATGVLQLIIGGLLAGPGHYLVGALGMVLWGTFLRVTIGLHAPWLGNFGTPLWGEGRFRPKGHSRKKR